MSTATHVPPSRSAGIDLATRPAAPARGFSARVLRFETRRLLRNRRTLMFTVAFPVAMFLLISGTYGSGGMGDAVADVGAYVMVSMALYGAVVAATSAGAAVSIERALGWSRQLRLSPLRPLAYITAKMVSAVIVGLLAVGVTFAIGVVTGRAHMPAAAYPEVIGIVLVGSLVFAAFGLFMGYVLPGENAMQILGPVIALLALVGGIFFPIDDASTLGQVAQFTPIYGLAQIAHWPLTETLSGAHAAFHVTWVVNLVGWGVLFAAGAVWRFRRDTARV